MSAAPDCFAFEVNTAPTVLSAFLYSASKSILFSPYTTLNKAIAISNTSIFVALLVLVFFKQIVFKCFIALLTRLRLLASKDRLDTRLTPVFFTFLARSILWLLALRFLEEVEAEEEEEEEEEEEDEEDEEDEKDEKEEE